MNLIEKLICEDYLRSKSLLWSCRNKATHVVNQLNGEKKYVCGVHAKIHPQKLVSLITEHPLKELKNLREPD